jgi:hypothetical protein
MAEAPVLCEACKGSGRADVVDLWSIQRTFAETGQRPRFDSFPMLKGAIACPKCRPGAPDGMKALVERLGDPWNPATFKETVQ